MCTRVARRLEARRSWSHDRTARTDMLTAAAVPRSVLQMQQQPEEMQRLIETRPIFGEKIQELRVPGIVCRPLLMEGHTQLSREPCKTQQTLRFVDTGNQCRQAVQHRWKLEVQIALLRRRAAVTRAVLPSTSAREQRLPPGLVDRTTNHWALTPPLDGGEDEDTDASTDTTVLDDNDDIASFQVNTPPTLSQTCDSCTHASLREVGRVDGTPGT